MCPLRNPIKETHAHFSKQRKSESAMKHVTNTMFHLMTLMKKQTIDVRKYRQKVEK